MSEATAETTVVENPKPRKNPSRVVVRRRLLALLARFWEIPTVQRIYHELWPDDPTPDYRTVWDLRMSKEADILAELDRQAGLSVVRGLTPKSRRLDELSTMAQAFRSKLLDEQGKLRDGLGLKEQEFYAEQVRSCLAAIGDLADHGGAAPENLGAVMPGGTPGVQYHQHMHYSQENLQGKTEAEMTRMFQDLLGQLDNLLTTPSGTPPEADQEAAAAVAAPPSPDG